MPFNNRKVSTNRSTRLHLAMKYANENDVDKEKYCNKLKIACEQALCLGKCKKIAGRREGKG